MADPLSLGIASLVVGTISSIKQQKAASKAAKAEERARRVDEARARRENQRQRRQQLREARIRRSEIIASGAEGGVLGSSGVQGGSASVESQAASNISEINMAEGFTSARNNFLNQSAKYQSEAARISAIGNTVSSGLSLAGDLYKNYQSTQSTGGFSAQFLKDNPSFASTR